MILKINKLNAIKKNLIFSKKFIKGQKLFIFSFCGVRETDFVLLPFGYIVPDKASYSTE